MPEIVGLNFIDWFKIFCTIVSAFITYSLFIFNYIEKVKKELYMELDNKVNSNVYTIQYENLVQAIQRLTDSIDKLEAKIDKMEEKWDKKLDNITRNMKTCSSEDSISLH